MAQLPTVISSLSDSNIAIRRISEILRAEERPRGLPINPTIKNAVEATGDFSYESAAPLDRHDKAKLPAKSRLRAEKDDEINTAQPFMLRDIDLCIPRGSFVCIFGRIGSGKTALLEGLLGEMRQTNGSVSFGGSLGLVPQTPWIQSASLKDNILFGKDLDMNRLQRVIHACALTRDIEELIDGLDTEIGGQCIQATVGPLSGKEAEVSCFAQNAESIYLVVNVVELLWLVPPTLMQISCFSTIL